MTQCCVRRKSSAQHSRLSTKGMFHFSEFGFLHPALHWVNFKQSFKSINSRLKAETFWSNSRPEAAISWGQGLGWSLSPLPLFCSFQGQVGLLLLLKPSLHAHIIHRYSQLKQKSSDTLCRSPIEGCLVVYALQLLYHARLCDNRARYQTGRAGGALQL